jgi:predicted  nucleic acid-binding Zn-ribbon protein
MSESSFLERFRSRWQEIARQFWPETPREQLQSELTRLDAELRLRQNRLLSLRKRIEKLRYHLNGSERNMTRLVAPAQEMPAATTGGAELERRQRNIDRLRERLQKHERGYARRLARLRNLKEEWTELRERFLTGSLAKRTSDESDPGYPF